MTISIGDHIADFESTDDRGERFRFADVKGKGALVFFFYPKDETAVCTLEACAFRDANAEFAAAGASVYGVSSDNVASHKGFVQNHKLPYRLLADVDGNLRGKVFQAPRDMLGLRPGRVTYVIDRDGVVRYVHRGLLESQSHVDAALRIVRDLGKGAGTAANQEKA